MSDPTRHRRARAWASSVGLPVACAIVCAGAAWAGRRRWHDVSHVFRTTVGDHGVDVPTTLAPAGYAAVAVICAGRSMARRVGRIRYLAAAVGAAALAVEVAVRFHERYAAGDVIVRVLLTVVGLLCLVGFRDHLRDGGVMRPLAVALLAVIVSEACDNLQGTLDLGSRTWRWFVVVEETAFAMAAWALVAALLAAGLAHRRDGDDPDRSRAERSRAQGA